MNCRSLEYVVAVFETGSLHDAAERCCATPGTISAQISRLEDYLGVRLFEQRGHPARLTGAGERLLPKMQEAVTQLREIVEEARNGSVGFVEDV